jgi:hypothetical protein
MQITSFCIERHIGGNLSPTPTYKNIDDTWRPWLGPQNALWFMPNDALIAVYFNSGEQANIETRAAIFWVYGYVTYLNVLAKSLTYKFLYRWDLTKGFVPEKRPDYT